MSIASLYDLQERLNNSAIAGVNMMGEDFRLHRAIEHFNQASTASPVFTKIAQQLQPLLQADTQNKTTILMDVLALIDAVITTQGMTQVNGELEPIVTSQSPYVACRYSELVPLKQAITEKGAGRYEVIRAAYETNAPALHDFRLKASLIAALGDSYSEIADLVKMILASEGNSVIPLLKQNFDPKGKRETVRRVEIIEQIAKGHENDFYLSLLEESSSIVKEAAVHALKHEEKNTDILIHLAETEKGAVKKAAYSSLTHMNSDRVEALWLKHAKKNLANVADYLDDNMSHDIADIVAQKLEELLMPLLEEKRYELEPKEVEQLEILLRMTINKSSSKLLSLYERLANQYKELVKLRDKQTAQLLSIGGTGSHMFELINNKLIEGMIRGRNEEMVAAAERLYRSHEQVFLHAGFAAALLSKPAEAVFDEFSPMLSKKSSIDTIVGCLSQVRYDEKKLAYCLNNYMYSYSTYQQFELAKEIFADLDPRWITLLTNPDIYTTSSFKRITHQMYRLDIFYTGNKAMEKYDAMLMGLINPNDKSTSAILYHYFLQASQQLNTVVDLYALHRLGHRDFHDLLIRLVHEGNIPIYELKRVCNYLHLSLEEQTKLIGDMIALMTEGKLKNRYIKVELLKRILEQLKMGDEVWRW